MPRLSRRLPRALFALLLIALAALVGCGGSAPSLAPARPEPMPAAAMSQSLDMEAGEGDDGFDEPPGEVAMPGRTAEANDAVKATGKATSDVPAPRPGAEGQRIAGPLKIYRATLTLAIFESDRTLTAVEKLALDLGGYLVLREGQRITVRVPARSFQGALNRIGELGDELDRRVEVEDVTEKFYDLKIRLKNARAVRDRLQQLLNKADQVKDALAVEKELSRVAQEVELLEGKLRLLKELLAYSTITVQLQAKGEPIDCNRVRLPFDFLNGLGLSNLLQL